MLFEFKKYTKDFFVEEILGFELSGEGDVFFVQFEKENLNTMDIIHYLCKKLHIERKDLGISGLKDKQAITRQRICIYKNILKKIGGTRIFLKTLQELTNVITSTWHYEPLAIGKHKYNHFKIILRFKDKDIDKILKNSIEKNITSIQNNGFPNCFGQQRFGKGNRNFKRARDILSKKKGMKNEFEIKFKLQAFSSMFFNHYTLSRWKSGQTIISGDILTNTFHARKTKVGTYSKQQVHIFDYQKCKNHYPDREFFAPNYYFGEETHDPKIWTPTGLILGYNMLLCPNGSKSFFKDWELIKKSEILDYMETIKKHQLWGIRRPLWVFPKQFSFSREKSKDITKNSNTNSHTVAQYQRHSLHLSFTLPTGAYATVLLGSIFENIDYKTCEQNKLLIPNNFEY